MKALVTGAGGFIGSHLTERLVSTGYSVRAFVHYNSRNTWGWLEESPCKNEIEVVSGDIRDFDVVRAAVKGCDIVFHLAALIGIPYSYVSPMAYIRTNIEGTYNILQSALESRCARVVHTSTSEVYGTAQYVPIDEQHPVNPQSPYSATKASADALALSFHRSFALPVALVRPFNTYGPRQSARAIIPTVIGQILAGRETLSLGNLSPTRDLTFVEDTASGFIVAAETEKTAGEVVNLGTGTEISIGDLVRKISRIMGREVRVETDLQRVRPAASEVERLLSSPRKMENLTGWKAGTDLESGLEATIGWMRERKDIYKNDLYNL